ncbi:hypothetical protein B1H10_00350 [candidate division KSB1 bacterium 4484_188]|nr:MAG: hypothetical protein B1H10_00350 [candidate division KSB1 bacterium 4484_188]
MKIFSVLLFIVIFLLVSMGFWFGAQALSKDIITGLDNAGIVLGYFLSCLTIAIAIIAWFRRQDIRRWLRRSHFESVGEPFDVPEEKVGCVVIPVSRREQPEWILRWLKPRYVSFLYSGISREIAAQLAEKFSQPPYQTKFFPDSAAIKGNKFKLQNPDDPEESKNIVSNFLLRFLENEIPREEIFVDTTGGKVPMSIGAFQAAEEMGISSIYVVGTMKGIIRDPQKREHGRPVFISDHTSAA